MGVFKYPPKHNNQNWSTFSTRKKRYDDANKKKASYPKKKKETVSKSQTLKPVSITMY